jgi:hypothetical protein
MTRVCAVDQKRSSSVIGSSVAIEEEEKNGQKQSINFLTLRLECRLIWEVRVTQH